MSEMIIGGIDVYIELLMLTEKQTDRICGRSRYPGAKVIAKLTNPFQDRMEIAESLIGILPQTMTYEEAREERLGEV